MKTAAVAAAGLGACLLALAILATEPVPGPAEELSRPEPRPASPQSGPAAPEAPSPDCPPSTCTPQTAYRCELLYRLHGIQRFLIRRAPEGFAYDPKRSEEAVRTVLDAATADAGDDWWNPVAARALHLLSDAGALDPAASRAEWLQALDDLIALSHTFELLSQEQKDAVAEALPALDRPEARAGLVNLWTGIRRTFRERLEPPRDGALCFHRGRSGPARRRGSSSKPDAPSHPGLALVLAHQGGLSRWPPNSMAALRRARDLGADGIECDLRLSGDGQVFVLHDERLIGAAGATLHVSDTAAAALERFSLLDPFALDRPSTESPLMLRALLDELGSGMVLWLELKPDGGDDLPERVGDLLAERSPAPGTVVVSSLSPAKVAPLRRRFPELLIAYEIVDVTPAAVEALAAASDAHRLIVSGLHFSTRSPDAFRRARELGLRTSSFTVNRYDALEQALAAGVDYIQTDRPDRALWLRDR